MAASVHQAGGYEISRSTVDSGGHMQSTTGVWEVSATIGQPDAGAATADSYTFTGGFWFPVAPGDCQRDGDVDGFDFVEFLSCLSGPATGSTATDCRCFDINNSGFVDMLDYYNFQIQFTNSQDEE
jgi:hypothetical protein